MTYDQTTEWMFQQLPMYQNIGKSAYKKDLSNSLSLDRHLNRPHQYFKSIHVAGTNGKGTTCHMLSSVLQTAGYKVGLYTSPHLKDFRERIKINGEMISRDEVVDFIDGHKSFLASHKLSFFEMTVGMAFEVFKKHQVDFAIIETGLGGRLDSTNIITPILSIITSIDLDHMDLLGNTLEKIALEKAGIIKPNIPIVINERRNKLRRVFEQKAENLNSPIYFAYSESEYQDKLFNKKSTEDQNQKLVRHALTVLEEKQIISITKIEIEKGLKDYKSIARFLGRYQIISTKPKIILDIAHNKAGLRKLIQKISYENYKQLHIVFGSVKDKDVNKSIELMPRKSSYYLCAANSPRSMDVQELAKRFGKHNLNTSIYKSSTEAFNAAIRNATENDLILVTGSNFIVSEII
ncbi:dihydrofolate synthase / folylpolyglutamate synthase [Nonlabens sp. Hel1_33_55]|nr:dihydrofolate synthase / folylpolyglutamate synthase [Nonlabens sp. Hel1_33_55]